MKCFALVLGKAFVSVLAVCLSVGQYVYEFDGLSLDNIADEMITNINMLCA